MNRQINESEQREKTIALAREEAMKKELMRKMLWQMSEIARIERGPATDEHPSDFAGYGGYLDGYCG